MRDERFSSGRPTAVASAAAASIVADAKPWHADVPATAVDVAALTAHPVAATVPANAVITNIYFCCYCSVTAAVGVHVTATVAVTVAATVVITDICFCCYCSMTAAAVGSPITANVAATTAGEATACCPQPAAAGCCRLHTACRYSCSDSGDHTMGEDPPHT